MSALDELTELADSLENKAVKEWKAKGKKVVGFFCTYVPEELLYAADILPYRMAAPGCTETTSADVYMSRYNCSFPRACLEFAFEGKYDFLDGYAFTTSCDDIRRMSDILRAVDPKKYVILDVIDVPKKVDDAGIEWYKLQITAFKEKVEKAFGVKITDEKLKKAIEVYNETRSLLNQLYDLRRSDKPPITGAETMIVLRAATSMPKDQFNQVMKRLLGEIKGREAAPNYRARLMISGGGGCDDPAYFGIMEELGGLVVTDTDCFGARYFMNPVEIKGKDLLQALAEAYMERPSCGRMANRMDERLDFMKEMVKSHKVDGVIYQTIRNCQLWGGQLLAVREEMKKANIPFMALDREYALSGTGQLKTRVQAFLERIGR
ncbi:MAG: 2-hydroxyacyl-CoA dehydratase family protein [Dehalococcoidia bacterium]|nr:2-hydroxyacyl-CoA dehydratase family protein [Dehalococcoidia bacterium]